jgi:hypothetical protein
MDRGWLRELWDLIEQAAAYAANYLAGNKHTGSEEGQGLLMVVPVSDERAPFLRTADFR